MIVRTPVTIPVAVGRNVTVTLKGMPGSTVAVAGTLENGGPEEVMEESVKGKPPLFVITSGKVVVEFTRTAPKLSDRGANVIAGKVKVLMASVEMAFI